MARYDLSSKLDQKRLKKRLSHLYKKGAKVELVEKRENRSLKQNAYLHLILGWFGKELGYTLEEVKQTIFKRQICKKFFEYRKGGQLFYRSTSALDTKEMTEAIDCFRNFASNEVGIYLPSPDEQSLLMEMEYELNRYGVKQYI